MKKIELLLAEVRGCTICRDVLPLEPRPVLQMSGQSRILVVGQAPGRKAHQSGLPFDDVSGDRLREWLGVDRDVFYDAQKIALLPMGFCYPGTGKSGDLPPRPECAPAWREKLLAYLPDVSFTLLLGQYAMKYHLPHVGTTLTETVRAWRENWPRLVPLPHPSPRNNNWLRVNSWFEKETIPAIQERVREILRGTHKSPPFQRPEPLPDSKMIMRAVPGSKPLSKLVAKSATKLESKPKTQSRVPRNKAD